MYLEVKRSPARVTWHILCNDITIQTTDTKREALEVARNYAAKYGLAFKGGKNGKEER